MCYLKLFCLLVVCTASACLPTHAGVKDRWNVFNSAGPLDAETVAAGLREALEKGTARAVNELGRENGFWRHPTLRIPVPDRLQRAERIFRKLGQDKVADDFVQSLNRAAEQATPLARDIFVRAVRNMSIRDAMNILRGPQDAATQYFRKNTEVALTSSFRPIVQRSTEAVGVTAQYKRFLKKAEPLGVVEVRELDIDNYVTQKALEGLFQLVAAEERRIREDPAARTTELLRKVFR